jgi:hypothetical protein
VGVGVLALDALRGRVVGSLGFGMVLIDHAGRLAGDGGSGGNALSHVGPCGHGNWGRAHGNGGLRSRCPSSGHAWH